MSTCWRQKLLETVIASSNPGYVVLDPFCGCGTTVDAAEKLGRQWIGIDITALAITLIKKRLRDTCGSRIKSVSGSAPDPCRSRREEACSFPPDESQSLVTSAPTKAEDAALPTLVRVIGEPVTPAGAVDDTFKKAPQAKAKGHSQHELEL